MSVSFKFAQDLSCMSASMFALGKVNKNSVKSLSVVCVWKNRRASAFPWPLEPVTHTRTQAFHRVTLKCKTKRKGGK